MIGLNYEQIIEKIKNEKNVDEFVIKGKIDEKLKQLGDLISLEGAAHIIAHEYNVKVYEEGRRKLKINDVVPGITSVDLIGKVVNVYGVREFNKNGKIGKVGSFLFGDETAMIRVALWDTNLIQNIESNALREGRIIEVKNGYVKENNGFKELHFGNKSSIVFDVVDDIEVKQGTLRRITVEKKISEITAGENVNVNGYVVQVFEPTHYDSCSECYKKVTLQEDKHVCNEHGATTARRIPILNFYLDDGSGNIRIVAFREHADKIINGKEFNELRNEVMGKKISVNGKVVKNEMFDRCEIIVNGVDDADDTKLIEEVLSL